LPTPTTTYARIIYVAQGEDALGNNQTLTAADKAALAGKTWQQVFMEIKARAFSTGKSRFRGVTFHKSTQKWVTRICSTQKKFWVGYWFTEEEAARAYDAAARCINGR
jgi:hypothetical protein